MKNNAEDLSLVDILVYGGTVITMDPERKIICDGAVAIEGDKILDVGTANELKDKYSADNFIDATNKILMPGLFDGHGHAGHSLLRTLGMHNETWWEACEEIYSQCSTEKFWEADALLSSLERLKFGTTCGVTFLGGGDSIMRIDDPVFGERHCQAVSEVGIREFLAVGPRRPPFPSKYSRWSGDTRRDYMVTFEEQVETSKKIIAQNNGRANGRIKIAMMHPVPHTDRKPITGSELDDLKTTSNVIREISKEESLLFTMDGHSRGTIKICHEELDLLGPDALFSHSTDLTAEEIRLCKETDTKIVHNPSAVASILGRCPVPELLDAGVTVVLGSDAGAPDRSYDMFRHMFQCMRYHRRYYRDARILPPGKVLEMVTIDGARAFGMEKELGSLEPGKKADLILVDVYKPHMYPFNLPVDRITYFANGNDVDTVIVDGEIIMINRLVKTVDEQKILNKAQEELDLAIGRSGMNNLFDITEKYWGFSKY